MTSGVAEFEPDELRTRTLDQLLKEIEQHLRMRTRHKRRPHLLAKQLYRRPSQALSEVVKLLLRLLLHLEIRRTLGDLLDGEAQ